MTDLIRFVKRLVEVLEERDPAGVHRPLSVADLRGVVFPYRIQRAALGLSSAEDYDLLVLRLVSEEEDFVRTYPAESAARARAEAQHLNPNLELAEELGDTTIQIGATALARIVAAEGRMGGGADGGKEGPGVTKLEFLDVAGVPPAPSPVVVAPAEWAAALPLERAADIITSPITPPPAALEPEPVFEPLAETIDIAVEPAAEGAEAGSSVAHPTTCRACHATLPDRRTVAFCPFCGERQEPTRCGRCGTELEAGWRHCVECGQPVATTGRVG